MIYTCTINPSLDYYVQLDGNLKNGELNRSNKEKYLAGGKGINVSIFLSNIEIPSIALGFLGGFIRQRYLDLLRTHSNIQTLFTNIEADSRINIKLLDGHETSINAIGPQISELEWEKLLNRIEKLDKKDIFVLSGNIQNELLDKAEALIQNISKKQIPFILDTNPDLIKRCLKYQPLLIKPNFEEFQSIIGTKLQVDINDICRNAQTLVEQGCANVLISLGKNGSIMVSASEIFYVEAKNYQNKSSVGAGDAMVAGFISSMIRGANCKEAFRYAVAMSYALINKTLIDKKDVENYYNEIEVKEL